MSEPIDVHEYIKNEIRPEADDLLKAHKPQTDKLKEILFSLPEEIKKKEERKVRLHVKELEALVGEIASHLSRTMGVLEKLEELEPDESFMKNRAEVEKVTAELGELERKKNKNYGIAKGELAKAKKAIEADDAETDASEILGEWAVMEAWLRKQLDAGKKRLDAITKVRDSAQKALDARDARALDAEIKKSAAIVSEKPDLQESVEQYEGLCKKCDAKKLTEDQQQQLDRERPAFDKMVEEIRSLNAKILAIDVVIEAMEVRSVDVKKAAKELDIPSSLEAKLKKALELDPAGMLKALDALAKEAKLKTSGKEMIAALKKAKLI